MPMTDQECEDSRYRRSMQAAAEACLASAPDLDAAIAAVIGYMRGAWPLVPAERLAVDATVAVALELAAVPLSGSRARH
jgi:hypothetical protein